MTKFGKGLKSKKIAGIDKLKIRVILKKIGVEEEKLREELSKLLNSHASRIEFISFSF